MPFYLEILLLLLGLVVIIILSMIIARRIAKQLSPKIGRYTYVVIGFISLYYLGDVVLHTGRLFENVFFYFWLVTFFCESLLFTRMLRRLKGEGRYGS
ncbi:MAG: hypothetical protein GXO75_14950 [Calditrichaeota bacterium]|nr:hypothetical protein [Calditrichota bacterium]